MTAPIAMRSPVRSRRRSPTSHITRPVQRSHWWREVLLIATFYGLYTLVRDVRGDRPVSVFQATTNAHRIIRVERPSACSTRPTSSTGSSTTGSSSVSVTTTTGPSISWRWSGCWPCCFSGIPGRYRLWRNTLALATGLALIGFSFFPVLPPRLLPARVPLRRHLAGRRRLVELLVRAGQRRLQSVRRDAQPAHHLVGLVRLRRVAPDPAALGQGPGDALSRGHHFLHHRDRQPLLRRRDRRPAAARFLLSAGAGADLQRRPLARPAAPAAAARSGAGPTAGKRERPAGPSGDARVVGRAGPPGQSPAR